ncbi:Neuroepithelial cell-transforming gene 1 protein [Nibea albiflora]|uniref:Neuroepithelial cell-transforming gene 1 protein n=1 Tax=Nibea albiflora TaxID=240163 RepID=A0ACB7EVJ0_NIBAL|nr:Neuroepithelial cell-transforming gene 1 protein [Nibea albiflora]
MSRMCPNIKTHGPLFYANVPLLSSRSDKSQGSVSARRLKHIQFVTDPRPGHVRSSDTAEIDSKPLAKSVPLGCWRLTVGNILRFDACFISHHTSSFLNSSHPFFDEQHRQQERGGRREEGLSARPARRSTGSGLQSRSVPGTESKQSQMSEILQKEGFLFSRMENRAQRQRWTCGMDAVAEEDDITVTRGSRDLPFMHAGGGCHFLGENRTGSRTPFEISVLGDRKTALAVEPGLDPTSPRWRSASFPTGPSSVPMKQKIQDQTEGRNHAEDSPPSILIELLKNISVLHFVCLIMEKENHVSMSFWTTWSTEAAPHGLLQLHCSSWPPAASLLLMASCSFTGPEPSNKRVRPLGRVTSLANLISPVKNGAVRRFGQTIQAIFELSRGEQDLIEDLQLARKAYHDPMLKLSIMSEEELTHIFGNLDAYIPLHEDLLAQLSKATGPDGTVGQIGQIVVSWLPRLNAYKDYCSNQLAAKALLDQKKQDRRVQDFLQRCLESPFSRKLDLWSFLDIPRSRLVKYPLLLKEILKHTPAEHPDAGSLEEAITIIQGVLSDINMKKGESECQYYIDKLEYLDDRQRDPRIEQCKSLLCHGELRNKSGTKLHVFLFTELLVLTRPVTRNERHCFQVYRQPIPVQDLVLEDLQDGDVRMGGSFRGAFSNADKAKNIFRVRSQDPSQAQSHTLQVNDVFHKQQWLNCLRSAISVHRPLSEPSTPSPPASDARSKRRPSSASAIIHMEETDENCPQPTSQSAPSSPCNSTTSSPTTTSPSSCSSSTSSLSTSSTSPLTAATTQKSKKDKKSLCSLGKRKETMV